MAGATPLDSPPGPTRHAGPANPWRTYASRAFDFILGSACLFACENRSGQCTSARKRSGRAVGRVAAEHELGVGECESQRG
jgi:hypothetical protein